MESFRPTHVLAARAGFAGPGLGTLQRREGV
jgi:hypothetical protein